MGNFRFQKAERLTRKKIIKELCAAYAMELETVQNYIAASVNLDGVRPEEYEKR